MLGSLAWSRTWPFVRAAAALLTFFAIGAQLERSLGNALANPTPHGSHVPTVIANFLSFFTIQSNLAAAVVLAIGAIWAWTSGRDAAREPRWYATLLACVTTYMIVTGIVYNLLLRGVELPQGVTVPWSNEVLHVVIPVVLALDLLLAPKRRALAWSSVAIVLIYPLAWIGYTVVRGPLIVAPATADPWWYPYPFLDPHGPGGVASVIGYSVAIAVAIAAVATLVVWVGHRREAADDITLGEAASVDAPSAR